MTSVPPPTLDSGLFNPIFYVSPVDITSAGATEISDPLTIGQIDATTLNTVDLNATGHIHLSKHIQFETGLLTGTSITLTETDLKRHYASTQTTDVDVYLPEINGNFKQVTLSALNTGKIIVHPASGSIDRIDDNPSHVNINAGVTKCFQSVSNDTTALSYNNWEFISTAVPDDLLVDSITLNKNSFYNANIVNSTPYSSNNHFRYYIAESGAIDITLLRLNENQFVRTSIYNESGNDITIFCNANDTILGGSSTFFSTGTALHLEGTRDSGANGKWIDSRPEQSPTLISDAIQQGVTITGNSNLSDIHLNKMNFHDGNGDWEITLLAYSGISLANTYSFCNNSSSNKFILKPSAGITLNSTTTNNLEVSAGNTIFVRYIGTNVFTAWGQFDSVQSLSLIEPVDRWQVNTVDSRLLGTNGNPVADFADVKRWLTNGDTAHEFRQEGGLNMPSYGSSPTFHEVTFNSVATEGLYCLESNWTLSERNANMTWYFVVYSTNNSQIQVLYTRGAGTSPGSGYIGIWSDRTVHVFNNNSPSANLDTVTTSTVPDSQYFVLTVVLDGSNPSGEYSTIYFDAAKQPTTGATQGSVIVPCSGVDFAIGTYLNGNTVSGGNSLSLNGNFKDVLVYSGSQHNQSQISQNVNYLKNLHGIP